MVRLRKLVQNIKSRSGYTDTIGEDLGIIALGEGSGPVAPTLTLASPLAGNVTLNWNKAGWTGVKLQGRTADGNWLDLGVDLGVDLYSPFVDTRPLATAHQPEKREYRASYLDGDTVQSATSQILEVVVNP